MASLSQSPSANRTGSNQSNKQLPEGFAIISHPDCLGHNISGHPEQPPRVASIMDAMRNLFEDAVFHEANIAVDDDIRLFHTAAHVKGVRDVFIAAGGVWDDESEKNKSSSPQQQVAIDGDTRAMKGTGKAAYRAAGSAIDAVKMLFSDSPIK
jgi:acetoin utilization deacetylase AcuC-like enzyme